jgi:monoamine oxidase
MKCIELYDQLRHKKHLRNVAMFVLVFFAAQDHPGGRISSVLHNGSWIETGAQWIHGQNNEVWKLADRYDLLSAVTSSEGEGKKLICSHVLLNNRDTF